MKPRRIINAGISEYTEYRSKNSKKLCLCFCRQLERNQFLQRQETVNYVLACHSYKQTIHLFKRVYSPYRSTIGQLSKDQQFKRLQRLLLSVSFHSVGHFIIQPLLQIPANSCSDKGSNFVVKDFGMRRANYMTVNLEVN